MATIDKIIEHTVDSVLDYIEFYVSANEVGQEWILVIGNSDFAFTTLRGATEEDQRKNAHADILIKINDDIAEIQAVEMKQESIKLSRDGDIKNYKSISIK